MNSEITVRESAVERVTCLIVDDLEENLLALSALLDSPDICLLQARSGMQALEMLLEHDVAVALLDVQMPEMDGFELAELMRGSERTQHIPILFLTAGLSDEQRQFKGYEAGAVDFLQKPIQPFVLKSKLNVFFQLYRQKRQLARDLEERTRTLQLHELFTAVLGHDLRNPLSAIIFSAAALQKSSDEEVRARSELITSIGWRMSRMIGDLLDLARIRLAGGITLERAPLDLGTLLQRVQAEQRAAHPESTIVLDTSGNLSGEWDEDRLAQVLTNLLSNAIAHGDPSAPISVHADGTHPLAVTIAVTNKGAIDPAAANHLFDPFADGRYRHRDKGLGLGLYIVKNIVGAHGGSVNVSRRIEGYTTFLFHLPRNALASSAVVLAAENGDAEKVA